VTAPRTYLVWSVVVTILFFLPTGLIALWFSLQARGADDPEAGRRAGRVARRWVVVTILIGVVLWGFVIAGLLLLGATNPLDA
jgi:TRAP-type mannitol/chloroaromatic compound transport system permease small subunit